MTLGLTMAGTGSKRITALAALVLLAASMLAQEVLLPVRHTAVPSPKSAAAAALPFFDDFSDTLLACRQWAVGGAFVNEGYAPLPPTRGMATLDAYDAEGRLYATATDEPTSCDTLASMPIRLDSAFVPYARRLTADDSVYLSFFYLPGGGYGNMWERVGDCPEAGDSLVLEFYDAANDSWNWIWSTGGEEADTLFARTGRYWQFKDVGITDSRYFNADFRFRFRNISALSRHNKRGILGNADQWNIDYVRLDAGRHIGDTASRDVAFAAPAASLLRHYQAMPARQYVASEMRDSVPTAIVNLFEEELATNYSYRILDAQGGEEAYYDGGHDNAPVFWHGLQYQTSAAHANPPVTYAFPPMAEPAEYVVVHTVREGVSGDEYASNDTARFVQVFDNYYAYDDGTPENGYGITSTAPRVKVACRFRLNVEDTLTAVQLYFNRTFTDENADSRFLLTVWDDADGRPGNVIYQDADRRKPEFAGFNRYVRYRLEAPLVCSGTIYVGFEQTSSDYINLGFDRNNDASAEILYLSGTSWQTSILRGALMLRPCFGERAVLSAGGLQLSEAKVHAEGSSIVADIPSASQVTVYDAMGRVVCVRRCGTGTQVIARNLAGGLYLVRVGETAIRKVIVPSR